MKIQFCILLSIIFEFPSDSSISFLKFYYDDVLLNDKIVGKKFVQITLNKLFSLILLFSFKIII